jgi:hypothetical protein
LFAFLSVLLYIVPYHPPSKRGEVQEEKEAMSKGER